MSLDPFYNVLDISEAIDPLSAEEIGRVFKPLSGRHEFQVTDALADLSRVHKIHLRFDQENAVLSGDLFADTQEKRWRFSWMSEAVYRNTARGREWDIGAICDIYPAKAKQFKADDKIFIGFRAGKVNVGERQRTSILSCRMAVVTASRLRSDYTMVGHVERAYPTFREIELKLMASDVLQSDPLYRALFERALGKSDENRHFLWPLYERFFGRTPITGSYRKPLQDTIYAAGIYVKVPDATGVVPVQFYSDISEPEAVFQIRDRARTGPRDPWTFQVVFLDQQDEDRKAVVPYGRVPGINFKLQRFRNREIALVFPVEIVRTYLDLHSDELGDVSAEPDRARDMTGLEDHVDAMAYRMLHTLLHEFGHLLNLPHPWVRDRYKGSRHKAEPHARSWMNYGSLYPFGVMHLYNFKLRDGPEQAKIENARARRSLRVLTPGGDLHDAEFAAEEKHHFRHARFDEIAAGHKSFTDLERPELSILSINPAHAQLELSFDGKKNPATGEVIFSHYEKSRPTYAFQPISGVVELPLDALKKPGDRNDLVFRFGAGSLFLLLRPEFPDPSWRHDQTRKTITYAPTMEGTDRRIWGLDPFLSRMPSSHHRGGKIVAPLPIIQPRLMFDVFNSNLNYTLQVVCITPSNQTLLSPTVRVRFETKRGEHPFGEFRDEIVEIVTDPNLTILAESASCVKDPTFAEIPALHALAKKIMAPRAMEAARQHPDLAWLASLQVRLGLRQFQEAFFASLRGDGTGPERPFALKQQAFGSDSHLFGAIDQRFTDTLGDRLAVLGIDPARAGPWLKQYREMMNSI